MYSKGKSATVTFKSLTTWAAWQYEVLGQLSDGKWENTAPFNHWKFWSGGVVQIGAVNSIVAEPGCYPTRISYGIVSLMNDKFHGGGNYILRDRMLARGRLARVLSENGGLRMIAPRRLDAAFSGAEYAPTTIEEFQTIMAEEFQKSLTEPHSSWKSDYFIALAETGFVHKFYAAVYTPKDLKQDLLLIKQMMKSVQHC